MLRILRSIGTLLMAVLNFDFNVTTSTFRGRSQRIAQTIRYELYALPVFVLLGWGISPIFHLLYGVAVGFVLAYQIWCVGVMYALAVLNLQFANITLKSLHKLLAVANVLPAAINDKADEIKAELERILVGGTGNLATGMDAFVKAVIGIFKIPTAAAETIITGLDQFITDIQIQVAAVPEGIKRRAKEQVGPVIYKVMNLQWWVLVISGVFWLLPWWNNPTAAVFLIAGGVLILLLMPANVKPDWAAAWPGITKVNKLLVAGAIVSLALAYSGNNVFSRPEIIALSLGLPLVVILPQLLGIRMSMSVVVLGVGIWGLMMPEHWVRAGIISADSNHTEPLYCRAVQVGGMPKFYRTPVANQAQQTQSSWWSPNKQYTFRPKRDWQNQPGEVVDFNTTLYRLENTAEKDITGGLWIKVVQVNANVLPTDETPFYVPLRGDYVEAIPAPGLPMEFNTNPSFDPEAGRTRINERNTLALIEFGRKKFGREFQLTTWFGFPPVEEFYADPLNVDFEVGNGFETSLSSGQEYLGVDLFCDLSELEVPVRASADGEIDGITLNSYLSVTIRHADGVWTHYGNLSKLGSTLQSGQLHSGKAVKQGEVIGKITRGKKHDVNGGRATLYFVCIRKQGNGFVNPVDPLPVIGRGEYPFIPQPAADDDGMLVQRQ